jgi:hypothetical protein
VGRRFKSAKWLFFSLSDNNNDDPERSLMGRRIRRVWKRSALSQSPILAAWERLVHRLHDQRSVGYATTGVVLLAVLLYSWNFWNVTKSGAQTAWVAFEHNGEAIASLQDDDPVVISGVMVGRIDHIEALPDGARALVEFFSYQKIHVDARAINFPQGLMGQRILIIDRGEAPQMLADGGQIPGRFQPGIAETMSRIEILVAQVNQIHAGAEVWIHGDSIHAPADKRIQVAMASIDAVATRINELTTSVEGSSGRVDGLDQKVRNLNSGLKQADAKIQEMVKRIEPFLDKAPEALTRIRPIVQMGQDLDSTLNDRTSPLIRLLHDDSLYVKLQGISKSIEHVQAIADGRVSIPFHFGLGRTFRFTRPERKD